MTDKKKQEVPKEAPKEEVKKEKKLTKDEIIKNLVAANEELKLDILRARADFDNYRKRKEEEIASARERGVISFVEDLLPAIDNFEMSLKMTDNTDMFIKGVEMIHGNLIDILKSNKFDEFSVKSGSDFDANEHDPILVEHDKIKPGKVVATIKKGYKKSGKIIRPARVQVVKEE